MSFYVFISIKEPLIDRAPSIQLLERFYDPLAGEIYVRELLSYHYLTDLSLSLMES